jgi:hypothetical protein
LLEADTPPLSAGTATLVWLPFAHAGKRLLDLVAGSEVTDRLLGAAPPAVAETPAPHLTSTRPPAHDAGDPAGGTGTTAPVSRTQTGAAAASRELEPAGPGRAR